MATLENAIRIASVAHEGQSDEAGQPCLLHPLRVMAAVEGEASQIVAVLHDVLKGARIKADDLRGEGFDDEILEALESITPRESEPYTSYILRCRINDLARKVKLAELVDNLQPSRLVLLPERPEPAVVKLGRYFLAYKYLIGLMTTEHYTSVSESGRRGRG